MAITNPICSICPVKDNKKAVATIVSDDGDLESGDILAELAAKYGVKISLAPTATTAAALLKRFQSLEKNFPIEILNHSWDHLNLTDAGVSDDDIRRQIIDSAQFFKYNFKTPHISFIPAFNAMSDAAFSALARMGILAARGWRQGVNTLFPKTGTQPGDWFNLKCFGVGDENFDPDREYGALKTNPGWLIEMWHNVYTDEPRGYQPVRRDAAEKRLNALKDAPHIWLAGFTETVAYFWQRDNLSLAWSFTNGILKLETKAVDPNLPWNELASPLTARVRDLPEGRVEPLENVENLRILDNGDALFNFTPLKSAVLKIRGLTCG